MDRGAWGHKELDTTEQLNTAQQLFKIYPKNIKLTHRNPLHSYTRIPCIPIFCIPNNEKTEREIKQKLN